MHGATIRLNGRSCACVSQQRSCWRLWWRQRPVPARSPPRAPLARRPLRSVGSRSSIASRARRGATAGTCGSARGSPAPSPSAEPSSGAASPPGAARRAARVAAWAGTSHRRSPTRVREDQRQRSVTVAGRYFERRRQRHEVWVHVRGPARRRDAGRLSRPEPPQMPDRPQAISTRATGSLGCSGRALVANRHEDRGYTRNGHNPRGRLASTWSDRGGGCESRRPGRPRKTPGNQYVRNKIRHTFDLGLAA